MYKISLEKNVMKFLEKHKGESIIQVFTEKLQIISKNPYANNLDIKALKGNNNSYRLRIGKYRFLYKIEENNIIILVFSADSRGGIYK